MTWELLRHWSSQRLANAVRGRVGRSSPSYSKNSSCFRSRLGDRLCWHKSLMIFLCSSRKFKAEHLKSGHHCFDWRQSWFFRVFTSEWCLETVQDHCLPKPYLITIYYHTYKLRLIKTRQNNIAIHWAKVRKNSWSGFSTFIKINYPLISLKFDTI